MVVYPNVGALVLAGVVRTRLAASKLRLFKNTGYMPNVSSTLAEMTAIEADFSGYPAGGATLTAWLAPLLNPLGGASIESGLVQFQVVPPTPPDPIVPNVIGGWFVVDSTGALITAGNFPNGVSMVADGMGIPMNVQLVFGSVA